MSELLTVNGLGTYFFASYGIVKAIDGISFEVDEGEAVGLVGESGSGKSTVALSIMRLIPRPGRVVSGQVILRQQDLLSLTEADMKRVRGKDIAMSFQDPMTFLNPVMRIGDQIAESCVRHLKMSKPSAIERAIQVMELVQIPDPGRVARSYPHQLSGGMRQRVLLSIAMSCNPSLLIVDEPTTALDVITQVQIINLLKQLRHSVGMAVLVISHDVGVVTQVCDRIAVMYGGRIVEQSDTRTVIDNALHPYTVGLLQSIPRIDTPKGKLKSIGGSVPDLTNPPSGCVFHPRCPIAAGECQTRRPSTIEVKPKHFVACVRLD